MRMFCENPLLLLRVPVFSRLDHFSPVLNCPDPYPPFNWAPCPLSVPSEPLVSAWRPITIKDHCAIEHPPSPKCGVHHSSLKSTGAKLLERLEPIKFLGVTIDKCLNWKLHADLVASKISKSLVVIRGMKQVLLSADMKKNSIMHLYIPTLLMVLRYGVRQVNRS